ncbi:flagellar hook assembly protein FlgD [Aquabacterium sp.]|uniref:flagellar hook assembly protein FlgD n=1 Tax=Aquabacterium sp. TaxID=1872578 RepID=UPI002B886345|nr:flagellar hook capping FlgD N-terminal domain-containing protein [Aquabacterium sp.]HSW05102.1 flagellar hook capping FlgD N-terminal domain-containing protein [Aquabacterium sp.]
MSSFDFSAVDTSSPVSPTSAVNSVKKATGTTATASEQTDRFLKLLVTQMQNQDPLNPMDNAQITTQMAQISTVSGIDDLNKSIVSMNSMLMQSQSLEAASLVGKNVLVAGDDLTLDADGYATAGFDLAGPAESVVVNVKNAAGQIIDSVNLGSAEAGRQSFGWKSADPKLVGLTFSVTALSGGTQVGSTPLVADAVTAVYSDGGQLNVETVKHGVVKYSDVKAVS